MGDNENRKVYEARPVKNYREMVEYSCKNYAQNVAYKYKKDYTAKNIEYIEKKYEQVGKDIKAFGTGLLNLDLMGERIVVVGKNRYEWCISYLATTCSNMVIVPIDKALPDVEMQRLIERSEAKAIIFDEKYLETIKKVQEKENSNLKTLICMDNIQEKGIKTFNEVLEEGRKQILAGDQKYDSIEIDENKMSIMLFTSGTTNEPKAVMLSQKNIASNVYAMQRVEDIRSTDSNLAFLPMHHIFGSTCLIMMLSCGVRNSFPDGLRYVSQNLKEYEVSVFVGVPLLVEAIYNRVVKEIEKQGKTKLIKNAIKISNFLLKFHIDIRRKLFKQIIDQLGGKMRFVISGGAPLDPKIQKGFIDLGIDMVQGYGLTETSPVIAAENMYKSKTGSIGVPMENVTVEIVNKDDNGIGELRAKGPNVMLGYYENEEETKNVLKDGWFYTGDLGYIDKEGFIFITGRQKNMIVLKNGKKIFPEEIETLVNRIDLVEECMVFGMPDEVDKNDVKLSVKVVYNKDEIKQKYGDISLDEIRDIIWNRIKNEVNTTVPRYKHIMNMILTDKELIKTTTKKVKRNEELKEILKK